MKQYIKMFEDFEDRIPAYKGDKSEEEAREKYYAKLRANGEMDSEEEEDFNYDEDDDLEEAADPMLVTSKDTMRIQDIMRKAAGNFSKAIQLATTMGKLITDKYKALRRARAAEREGYPELADIFFRRYAEL